MKIPTFLARRFVAGDTLKDAIPAVRRLNKNGLKVTLDFLGEECRTREQAEEACLEYIEALRRIDDGGVDCNVSLKLTQFGLSLDAGLARDNVVRVLEEAKRLKNFVRIDMEGSAYTQKTLDLFYSLQSRFPRLGVVLQSNLRRSRKDVATVVKKGLRVRLCKGAYREPKSIAFSEKEKVDLSYDELAVALLKAPNPAFATHDDERIAVIVAAAEKAGVSKKDYEIQMLYGLRPKRWRELHRQGHVVRVYVPYGSHWFPYFYRRLRERKENIMFIARNFFRA